MSEPINPCDPETGNTDTSVRDFDLLFHGFKHSNSRPDSVDEELFERGWEAAVLYYSPLFMKAATNV
jgi:hypothetical protein